MTSHRRASAAERLLLLSVTTLASGTAGTTGAISLFGYRCENDHYYSAYALVWILSGFALAIFTFASCLDKSAVTTDALACLSLTFLISFFSFAVTLPLLSENSRSELC